MLRLVVLLLLLANGVYYAWSQGTLLAFGLAPMTQTEPHRMTQQIRPEALRLLEAEDAPRSVPVAAATGGGTVECMQAGPYDEQQSAALRQALDPGLPPTAWRLVSTVEPARWIVYMGKFSGNDALEKKKAELRQIRVPFEATGNASLEPGLTLGASATQAGADRLMAALVQRGVRTARVVQERAEVRGNLLRFDAMDSSLRIRLEDLSSVLAGKTLRACS